MKPGEAMLLKSTEKAIAIRGIGTGKESHYNLLSKYRDQEEFKKGEHSIKDNVVDADTIWKTMDPEYAKGHILIDARSTTDNLPITYKAARLEEAVIRAERAGRDYSEVPETERVQMVRDRVGELIKAKNITEESDRIQALENILPKNFTAKFERDKDSPYLLITIVHKDNEKDSYGGRLVFKVDDLGSDAKPNPRIPAPDKLIQEIYVQSFDTKVGINKESPTDLVKKLPLIRPNAKPVEAALDTTKYSEEVERNNLLKLRDELYKKYIELNQNPTEDNIRKARQIERQLGNLNDAVTAERGALTPKEYDEKVRLQFQDNILDQGYTKIDAELFDQAGYDISKLPRTVEEIEDRAKEAILRAKEEKQKRIDAEKAAKDVLEEKDKEIAELKEASVSKQEYIDALNAQQEVADKKAIKLQNELENQAQELEKLRKELKEKEEQIASLQENKPSTGSMQDDKYIEMIDRFGKPISVEEARAILEDVQKAPTYDPADPENMEDLKLIDILFRRAEKPDGTYRTLEDQENILLKYYLGRLDTRRLKKRVSP